MRRFKGKNVIESVGVSGSIVRADKYSARLMASDFSNGNVLVRHDDGTQFLFCDSFSVHDPKDDYIWVFTEHHGYYVFAKNELTAYLSSDIRTGGAKTSRKVKTCR